MKFIVYILGLFLYDAHSIFTHKHHTEGNTGIGKLPNELLPLLENIPIEYMKLVPDKTKTTHHMYYNDLRGSLQSTFHLIQSSEFWYDICEDCIILPVKEMNELYYSNPKPNFASTNLYGAAANLIPHHDCVLFNFKNIRFYRVIIGVTENNQDTITEFINIGVEHKINRGDYMIFDFDRTLHQVKKTGEIETPRILLKLHYITCDGCKSVIYVNIVSLFYKMYYYIARYTEQIGTDPTTFLGFFFGLLWEYPFYMPSKYVPYIIACNIVLYKICDYYFVKLCMVYLMIVSFYYLRFIFFAIK